MSELNSERALVSIVRAWASRNGVRAESLGEGWVLRLTRARTVRYIHGYAFDLNTAATHNIACDKAATGDVLGAAGLPRVEHRLYLHPDLARYVRHPGNWKSMLAFFEACNRDVVVKDNTGTGGRGVHRARTEIELEVATLSLFGQGHSVAVSPFIEIEEETRLVMLEGRCEAAYSKVRPTVTGDAQRTVLELLAEQVALGGLTAEWSRFIANLDAESAAVLREKPAKGVRRLLNWRHNLGQGAAVRIEDATSDALQPRINLAKAAASALNLSFGSVDVVRVNGHDLVLEVNAGVMMEAFVGIPGGAALAQGIYERALAKMFA